MSRDKQIEEMAKLICSTCQRELDPCSGEKPCRSAIAESNDLYNAGYRKASDVAREIFEEIEEEIKLALEINKEEKDKLINSFFSFSLLRSLDSKIEVLQAASKFIAKLKMKYEILNSWEELTHTCQVEIPHSIESIVDIAFQESEGEG